MSHTWNKIALLSAIGAACSLAVWLGATNAKEESSVLVNKPPTTAAPEAGPALPPPVNPSDRPTTSTNSSDLFLPPLSTTKQSQPIPPQTMRPSNSGAKQPFLRPAEPREPAKGKLVIGAEPMPLPPGEAPAAVPSEGIKVQPTPPIEYDTDHDARRMYRSGKVELVMLTTDPTDGCTYEIPMCIPACCVGDPKISGGRGIFGRGVVEYCWPCGFTAKVKFRHVLGDVKVEYEGD